MWYLSFKGGMFVSIVSVVNLAYPKIPWKRFSMRDFLDETEL